MKNREKSKALKGYIDKYNLSELELCKALKVSLKSLKNAMIGRSDLKINRLFKFVRLVEVKLGKIKVVYKKPRKKGNAPPKSV